MLKEEKQYKFIKDIEAAKEIFKDFCSRYREVEIENVGKTVFGEYCANVNLLGAKTKHHSRPEVDGAYCCVLKNDYEVLCLTNMKETELLTEKLRKHQTKVIGKEYVDSLEEFLTQNVQTEVSKYRKLLEEQE